MSSRQNSQHRGDFYTECKITYLIPTLFKTVLFCVFSNLTHLFVFSRLIINTGGIHIEKHYIRCEILTTLRHFESNLICISFLINYPFSLFLSSFSFHSFNLACRNLSCMHSIPGQRPVYVPSPLSSSSSQALLPATSSAF